MPYTTPGLGDMTHTVLIGYLYTVKNNTPVTLHLTEDKWNRDKPETYQALLELLPPGKVFIKVHPVQNISDFDFIKYIAEQGDTAELYCYMDVRHQYDTVQPIDISEYFKQIPKDQWIFKNIFEEMKEEPRTEILKYLDNNLYLEQSADKLRNWESEYYGGIL
jgi:hypothetical protein